MRLFFFCLCLFMGLQLSAQSYQGKVFLDQNENGLWDTGEEGVAGVSVSDGKNVVKTNSRGEYSLPGPVTNHFIFITVPNAYQTDAFFYRVYKEEHTYNFPLQEKAEVSSSVNFLQITDTETWEYNDWIDDLKGYVKSENPDFIIHTGDICYKEGLHFHQQNVNTQTMGVPVHYCIGNHDLVEGEYGEELYEELFGPTYYSFEAGNIHFIITPMLHGDYQPSYTKEEVYQWLKNDLSMLPENKKVIIFNHDLLTNVNNHKLTKEGQFIYRVSDQKEINLNNHNLIAWIYGHWHTNLIQKMGKDSIYTICSAPSSNAGIDHSATSFRGITVNKEGQLDIKTHYNYVDHQLVIAAPGQQNVPVQKEGSIQILANTYNSASPVSKVRFSVIKGSEEPEWSEMSQRSSWSWNAKWQPKVKTKARYFLQIEAILNNGDTVFKSKSFIYNPANKARLTLGEDWPLFLQNTYHHPQIKTVEQPQLQLAYSTNVGAPIFMASPIIADGMIFTATLDEGNLDEGRVVGLNAKNGKIKWTFPAKNAIKGAIAYTQGKVYAVDVEGRLYAIDAQTGELSWEKRLDYEVLPAHLQGVIAVEDTVFAGAGKGLYAMNAADGKVLWHNTAWDRADGSTANQTLAGNVLVAAANWTGLFGNDASTGKLLWSRKDKGLRFRDGTVTYVNDTLFATGGTRFFELDPHTGETLRSREFPFGAGGLKSSSSPLITNKLIIFGTANHGMVALSKKTLNVKWRFNPGQSLFFTAPYSKPPAHTVASSPIELGDYIFFGASDGKLYLLDKNTGRKIWEKEVGSPVLSSAAVSGNLLTIADFGGNVYVFEIK